MRANPSSSSKSPDSKSGTPSRKNKPSCSREKICEEFFCSHTEVLMNAARSGNEDTVMKLYFKWLDLTKTDEDGNTALHIAAMNGHALICRLLVVLTTPIMLWRVTNKKGLKAEQLATTEKIRADLHCLEHKNPRTHCAQAVCNDRLVEQMKEWPENAKLLFSFDGGGMKVLIINQILVHLDSLIPGGLLPRIDWIGGTSSGGLLSLMLGQDRSMSSARRFFLENGIKTFCGNTTKFPKHDVRGLEDTGRLCYGVNARMSSMVNRKIMLTVADTRKSPAALILFRSYAPRVPDHVKEEYGYLDPDRILIWKAGRCTAAAPYYFSSYNGLSDGGLVANNPTLALLSDFHQFHELERQHGTASSAELSKGSSKTEDSQQRPSVGVVVSFGTGQVAAENTDGIDFNIQTSSNGSPLDNIAKTVMGVFNGAKNAFQLLLKEVTASDGQPVRYARAWCHSMNTPYFRFCPHLETEVAMDNTEVEALVNLMWDAELYIRCEVQEELEQLAALIARKPLSNSASGERAKVSPGESDDASPNSLKSPMTESSRN